MIFTRGITCMRLKSASVRGCASGSARAACSTASVDIGRRVFPEILILFMFRYFTRRNDSDSIFTFRISYEQQNLSLSHPDEYEAILFVLVSIVQGVRKRKRHRILFWPVQNSPREP